jgi:hypothetical protein
VAKVALETDDDPLLIGISPHIKAGFHY